MMRKLLLILLLWCVSIHCYAQHYDTVSIFKEPIQMDSVVIVASKGGFDVAAFVRRVQTDTTFYKAFKSVRVLSFNAVNDIKILGKNNTVIASYYSKTRQTASKGRRTMQVADKKTTGDFYDRKGQYNYYTAQLYDYLFFTHGTECNQTDVVANSLNDREPGTIGKSKYQLKQLIFNPGAKIAGVPLMGDKAAIFDEEQSKKYDFKILSDVYEGQDCYVFKITPKPGEEKDVVYNELTTWFRKSDYSIVARDYSLSFNTMVYDFDVRMKVRTTQIGNKLLPTSIDYDGNWHVLTKSRERARFTAVFSY